MQILLKLFASLGLALVYSEFKSLHECMGVVCVVNQNKCWH